MRRPRTSGPRTREIVLSPRWLTWHVLAMVAVLTCLVLGRWQWDRANEADGSLQNLGYALQWPLFAVFFAVMWWRMLRLDLQAARSDAEPAAEHVPPPAPPGPPAADRAAPPPVTDDEDPALAAYNRMLAELARRDRES